MALLDSIGPGIYSVMVTDANECQGGAVQNIIDLGNEKLLYGVEFYPNPVEGLLHIRTSSAGSYEVYNAMGDRVSFGLLATGQNSIDLNALSSGLYVVQMVNENEGGSFKIVKR
jgi:hypothetical protein